MIRTFGFAVIVLLGLGLSTYATTVTFNASPASRSVVDASSNAVSTTSLVWVGTFSSPNAFNFNSSLSISANVANIESLGGWAQFGLDPSTQQPYTGTPATLVSGALDLTTVFGNSKVGGSITDNNKNSLTDSADFFNGKQIYIWIFNASTVAGATQMGIFDATGATPAWNFPTNAGGVGDTVDPVTSSSAGAAPTMNAIGNAGNVTSSTLQLVPEPSTWVSLIGATGFLAMLRRRRAARS